MLLKFAGGKKSPPDLPVSLSSSLPGYGSWRWSPPAPWSQHIFTTNRRNYRLRPTLSSACHFCQFTQTCTGPNLALCSRRLGPLRWSCDALYSRCSFLCPVVGWSHRSRTDYGDPHCATSTRSRWNGWSCTRIRICLGRGISALDWQRIRVGSWTLGPPPACRCHLGATPLRPHRKYLDLSQRILALGRNYRVDLRPFTRFLSAAIISLSRVQYTFARGYAPPASVDIERAFRCLYVLTVTSRRDRTYCVEANPVIPQSTQVR